MEKRLDDEVGGEPTSQMGSSLPPPPPMMHQETIPMRAPLIAPIQAGIGTGSNGVAGVGGKDGIAIFLVRAIGRIKQISRCNESRTWQYVCFVKNGGHSFSG